MKFTIGSYEIFGLVRFCLDGPLHEGGVKVQASEGEMQVLIARLGRSSATPNGLQFPASGKSIYLVDKQGQFPIDNFVI